MGSDTTRTAETEWRQRRQEILERDEYLCQACGCEVGDEGEEAAEIHHRTPVSEGGSDEPENLLTLCSECHKNRHGKVTLKDVIGVFDRVRGPPAVVSTDVAEMCGCTTSTAKRKLKRLHRRGVIEKRSLPRQDIFWKQTETSKSG